MSHNDESVVNESSPEHETLAYAYGKPTMGGVLKQECEDFIVTEDLGFPLSGAGEHLCVKVRKRGVSTSVVANTLAKLAGIRERDVGYAGLKDRQGVCEQWFSLYLAHQKDIDLTSIASDDIQILEVSRNDRKIRRGSHRANGFAIRLRDVSGDADDLEQRLAAIAVGGVPNFFGEQRFGHGYSNIDQALRLFRGEMKLRKGFKRGMLLSAARSYVFNAVLSQRVANGSWNSHMQGDVMNLQGTESVFVPEAWDAILDERLQHYDIHPTGPLWGKGKLKTCAETEQLEIAISDKHEEICAGLVAFGLEQARRSLRLMVGDLEWQREQNCLLLEFKLPPGAYATSVLREVLIFK